MSRPKVKYIPRDLLRSQYIALCTSEKDFLSECKRLGVDSPHPWLSSGAYATTHTLTNTKAGELVSIVCYQPRKCSFAELAGMFAHEAVHVAQRYFEDIGEKEPGEEIRAYVIEAIVTELLRAYKGRTLQKGTV